MAYPWSGPGRPSTWANLSRAAWRCAVEERLSRSGLGGSSPAGLRSSGAQVLRGSGPSGGQVLQGGRPEACGPGGCRSRQPPVGTQGSLVGTLRAPYSRRGTRRAAGSRRAVLPARHRDVRGHCYPWRPAGRLVPDSKCSAAVGPSVLRPPLLLSRSVRGHSFRKWKLYIALDRATDGARCAGRRLHADGRVNPVGRWVGPHPGTGGCHHAVPCSSQQPSQCSRCPRGPADGVL